MLNDKAKCGFVTLVGRPNVGKSSILNCLVNDKVSIISSKPQTTRQQIQGVKTLDEFHQIVYVDTPGIHQQARSALNRFMNKTAQAALHDVDLILYVVEALKWTDEDNQVLELIKKINQPTILVVNKIDKIKDKSKLLAYLQMLSEKYTFKDIIPVSALKLNQIDVLEKQIIPFLPESSFFYQAHEKTNQSFEFHVAELIREQLMHQLNQELPYSVAVQIEKITDLNKEETATDNQTSEENFNQQILTNKRLQIHALIWVEKPSQKIIIIGEKGERLKSIGRQARLAMNNKFNCRVDLRLWVKVKSGWSDSTNLLSQMGYYAE